MIEIQSDTGTWYQRWGVRTLSLGGQVMVDWMVGKEKGRGEVDRNAGLEPVCGVVADCREVVRQKHGELGLLEVSAATV